jgi:hypothetical protein
MTDPGGVLDAITGVVDRAEAQVTRPARVGNTKAENGVLSVTAEQYIIHIL